MEGNDTTKLTIHVCGWRLSEMALWWWWSLRWNQSEKRHGHQCRLMWVRPTRATPDGHSDTEHKELPKAPAAEVTVVGPHAYRYIASLSLCVMAISQNSIERTTTTRKMRGGVKLTPELFEWVAESDESQTDPNPPRETSCELTTLLH